MNYHYADVRSVVHASIVSLTLSLCSITVMKLILVSRLLGYGMLSCIGRLCLGFRIGCGRGLSMASFLVGF